MSLFGSSGPDLGKMLQQVAAERQQRIRKGIKGVNQAFAGFTPTFYDDYAQKVENSLLPHVATNAREANKALTFGVANRGLAGSSTAQQQQSRLNRQVEDDKRNVVDTSIAARQQLRQQIMDQRNRLISMLYESAEPAMAATLAVQSASQFKSPNPLAAISGFVPAFLDSMGNTR